MSALTIPRRELPEGRRRDGDRFQHARRGVRAAANQRPARVAVPGPPDQKLIDTWIAIHADNTATAYIGYAELGQGASTALLQIAAEELDLDMSQISSVRLDTHVTPNQGATVASAAIERGGPQIRAAAAEARQALLTLASRQARRSRRSTHRVKRRRLGSERPVEVRHVRRPARRQAVRDRADRRGPAESSCSSTPLSAPAIRVWISRTRSAARYTYVQHVRLPGMLHARVVRPPGQGAVRGRRTHRQPR